MQVSPEPLLTEERLEHLGSLFAECVKEVYKNSLPKAKFTVYMRTPKYDDKGNMSSVLRYEVSDNTVDDKTLKEQMDLRRGPLTQCFLDKISPNKDREPGRNWVEYNGGVLMFEAAHPSMSNESIEDITFDESKWIEIVKFAQRDNWFSKIEITPGQIILTVVQLTAPEIWGILKPHLSEVVKSGNEHLTDLVKKIQDLPIEEILDTLEEIGKILNSPFL